MPSSHLILCRPLFLLPPIPLSIWVFSNESTLHVRWPKYWSFSFTINPSKEHFNLYWGTILHGISVCFCSGIAFQGYSYSKQACTLGILWTSTGVSSGFSLPKDSSPYFGSQWNLTIYVYTFFFFPGGSNGKESTCNAGDPGLVLGMGRSPGEGNDNPLQYSCLENLMDRGDWRATVSCKSMGLQRVRHDWTINTSTLKQPWEAEIAFPFRAKKTCVFRLGG